MATEQIVTINDLVHPFYAIRLTDWRKWRLCFEGGQRFLDQYLYRFDKCEEQAEFIHRKKMSYSAAFAKVAIIEVRDSIYQRLVDITREGGSQTYQDCIKGLRGGVDLLGSSMNTFMGTEVLPELLVMDKVGIYVDMPPRIGESVVDNLNIRPYLYVYTAEDIRSWIDDNNPNRNVYKAVLLRDRIYEYDKEFGLPTGQVERYRYYWKDEYGVWVQFYDAGGDEIDEQGNPSGPIALNISRIPFIPIELGGSLMTDIADYQIALTNLGSADMSYAIRANFPLYTEQFDPRWQSVHLRQRLTPSTTEDENPVPPAQDVQVGPTSGRRYPLGAERPGFIAPSAEPLRASMEKQEQLKMEIRLLLNLAISNIQPKMASAASKGMDERTLESGLSYIGLLLEDAERQVGEVWAEYEGNDPDKGSTVHYPTQYSLKSDDQRRNDVVKLTSLSDAAPSDTYRREIAKLIAKAMFESKVPMVTLRKMIAEIDSASVVNVSRQNIIQDVQAGLVDLETASQACGYPKGTVNKAKADHAERLARIQAAQTPQDNNPAARGIPDQSGNPTEAASAEKQQAVEVGTAKDGKVPVRGPGKNK